jgi:hypothetical protein
MLQDFLSFFFELIPGEGWLDQPAKTCSRHSRLKCSWWCAAWRLMRDEGVGEVAEMWYIVGV